MASFREANALQKAIAKETKKLEVKGDLDLNYEFMKNLLCSALASDEIEAALKPCLKRCLYGDFKIDENTFEDVEARQDYFTVCFEVIKENLLPFVKGLSFQLKDLFQEVA